MTMTQNEAELALVERARGLLPAGGLGNMSADTIIARGRAGRVWDVSGHEYVDFCWVRGRCSSATPIQR